MRVPIPIFIITKDRLEVLKESIDSFKQISFPTQIVIHDNNSTYKPLLDYFDTLSKEGVVVYRNRVKHNSKVEELHSVRSSIDSYFSSRKVNSRFYVVTDPDIALDNVSPDIFDFYMFLLDKFKGIKVVGPQLRIDDIPDFYPLKKKVFQRHSSFWNGQYPVTQVLFKGRKIKCVRCPIDTTFGMYRAGYKFTRLSQGFRTYAPYAARHLDWYLDPRDIGSDTRHYMKTEDSLKIGHWSTEIGLLHGKVRK